MDRVWFLVAVALALLWQSNCVEYADGVLVNRCGLYQRFTGYPMTIAMGPQIRLTSPAVIERERVIEKTITIEKPTVIYRDQPPQVIYRDRPSQVIVVDPRNVPRAPLTSFSTGVLMTY